MRFHTAATMLRWGLAFVFFYAAISVLRSPFMWVAFVPDFLSFVPQSIFVTVFAAVGFVLAIWLFWGRKIVWAAAISAIIFALVVILDIAALDQVFQSIGLFMASLALLNLAREKGFREEEGGDGE